MFVVLDDNRGGQQQYHYRIHQGNLIDDRIYWLYARAAGWMGYM
jgi:hypothetical protein